MSLTKRVDWRKTSPVGRKSQKTTDASLARPHAAGSKVRLIQYAEHKQLGTIAYEVRRLWVAHLQVAEAGYRELKSIHNRILYVPVNESADRLLTSADRPDYGLKAYDAGSRMVLNVVLTMQHFCYELEQTLRNDPYGGTIEERMKAAFAAASLPLDARSKGYAALREIIDCRDALEHPKRVNVRNSHPTDWDRVPFGWFLVERSTGAFQHWTAWFGEIAELWEKYRAANRQTVRLTVQRGVKSTRQFKKPPTE